MRSDGVGVGWGGGEKRGEGYIKHETPPLLDSDGGSAKGAGDGLLSRELSPGVPSALSGLTTVFGMGTGCGPDALVASEWGRVVRRHSTNGGSDHGCGPPFRGWPRGRYVCFWQIFAIQAEAWGSQAARAIRTAARNVSPRFHVLPIDGVVSSGPSGSSRLQENSSGGRFHLDAFSGYRHRPSLPGVQLAPQPGHERRPTRSLSY